MRWRPRRGLRRPGSRCDGRHLGPRSGAAADGGAVREGQPVTRAAHSVPAALCDKIARAATEELAERLSIPD